MNPELKALLQRGGGLVTRSRASEVVPMWTIEHACRRGHLIRVLPGVYRDPGVPVTPSLLNRAALAWLDGRGALSHTTALALWGLHHPAEPAGSVHVTVPSNVRIRSQRTVTVHRRSSFAPEPPYARIRAGQLVTPIEQSLVDAWPILAPADRRAPVIQAVNDRLSTPGRIRAAMRTSPKLAGRAELDRLLDLLAAGCRSPLEIFGHEHVFTAPGMPEFQRQVRVKLGRRVVYLDVYAEAEMVNFELDGARVHNDPRQHEADLRRDALLATLGMLVVRFTHSRLVYETAALQREILAILASRHAIRGPCLLDPLPATRTTRRRQYRKREWDQAPRAGSLSPGGGT
jgi:very-short-patch-repair endonuclease